MIGKERKQRGEEITILSKDQRHEFKAPLYGHFLMTTQNLPASRRTCTKVGVQLILLIHVLALTMSYY